MKLVRLENYQVVIEDELLLLVPFRKLYKKDKTRGKDYFMNFMTVLYFTYDLRSDYQYIAEDESRLKEVCESNGIPVPEFSDLEKECINLYKKLTTTSSQQLLKSTKIAVEKVRRFLEEEVDLSKLDDKGKPIYPINTVVSAIKQIPLLSKDVMEAERAVAKEIEEQGRARGGNDSKSLMDDGIFI